MKNQSILLSWLGLVMMLFGVGCENTDDNFSSASFASQTSNSAGNTDWQQQSANNTLQSSEYYNEDQINSENTSIDPMNDDSCAMLTWDWPSQWTEIELEVLDIINHHRLAGANCGVYGFFAATSLIVSNECLTAAARLHAEDMALQSYFSHISLDGRFFEDRVRETGYGDMSYGAENIAANYRTAEQVVSGWMASDSHCQNIMNPLFQEIGIGYYYLEEGQYKDVWVQKFAAQKNQ